MPRPMPSPNGTNFAGLFVRDPGPIAAYDSATGLRGGHDKTTVRLGYDSRPLPQDGDE